MKKIQYVDYDNCITNLTSSIQKYYGLKPNFKTNTLIDQKLQEKEYQNVIIFVFDALGDTIIKKNTSTNHYLQKHQIGTMHSTFPPTTANCTTAFITGENPITTGWLGWSSYYKDLNMAVDNYPNCDALTKEKIIGDNIANRKIPTKELGKIIEEATNKEVKYYSFWPPFKENGCRSLRDFARKIIKLCNQEGKKYIYAYWDEPDKSMHQEGTSTNHIKKIINDIGKILKHIEKKTKNTIGIVSADHGQVDVVPIALYTYYDILNCLYAPFTCDSRTAFFFVKDNKKEEFVSLFNQYFSDFYDLYTKDEIINNHIFGYGLENPLFKDLIGDYVAIAKDKYYFVQSPDGHNFKGHHAGGLVDEYTIPIIVFNN